LGGRGIELQLHSFITSSLVGGEWSTSCPGHFTPGEKTAVGPTTSLDFREKTFSKHIDEYLVSYGRLKGFNPLNAELNPICYLLALLGAHYFLHVSRIRVKSLTLGY